MSEIRRPMAAVCIIRAKKSPLLNKRTELISKFVYKEVCSSLNEVLSDERLGAKVRVTENRCVLFNSLTYVYIYIYIYIYISKRVNIFHNTHIFFYLGST